MTENLVPASLRFQNQFDGIPDGAVAAGFPHTPLLVQFRDVEAVGAMQHGVFLGSTMSSETTAAAAGAVAVVVTLWGTVMLYNRLCRVSGYQARARSLIDIQLSRRALNRLSGTHGCTVL